MPDNVSLMLAIDTSTDIASLALAKDNTVLAELTWRSYQNHTIQLTPNIDCILKLARVTPKNLTAIAIAKGPGSFNGLRVGISVAKGLAFSLEIPIIGVSSLEVEAYQYANVRLPVCPVFSAGRDEVVVAVYGKHDDSIWQEIKPAHIVNVTDLAAEIHETTLFCGEYLPQITSKLKELLGGKAVIASPVTDLRRAGFLVELAMKQLLSGNADNAATLSPIYLRRPPITGAKPRLPQHPHH